MAIGSVIMAGMGGARQTFQPTGGFGVVQVIHDSLTATANTAAELLHPTSVTSANFHWCKRSPRARAGYLSARYPKAATVTTDPAVRLVGAWPTTVIPQSSLAENSVGALATDGTWFIRRLDVATAAGTATTLDLVTSGASSMNDATFAYTDESAAFDLLDCWYFGLLVETAAVINAGTVSGLIRLVA